MVNDMSKCAYLNCDEAGTHKRMSERHGVIYRFCVDHDPVDDDRAFRFTVVQ